MKRLVLLILLACGVTLSASAVTVGPLPVPHAPAVVEIGAPVLPAELWRWPHLPFMGEDAGPRSTVVYQWVTSSRQTGRRSSIWLGADVSRLPQQ